MYDFWHTYALRQLRCWRLQYFTMEFKEHCSEDNENNHKRMYIHVIIAITLKQAFK